MQVYICQPLDKPYKELEESRAYAIKRVQELGHTVVDDYVRDESGAPRDAIISSLGSALLQMGDVDAVFFIDDWENNPKCRIIHEVCEEYDIKIFDPRIYN